MLSIKSGRLNKPVKAVIYGLEGTGKSTLAAHTPNPLFLDTEGGTTYLDVNRIDQFTGTRLTVSYRVIDAADKTLRAEGETRHCFLNRQGRPVSLKKENPAAFERFCALAGQDLYEKIR